MHKKVTRAMSGLLAGAVCLSAVYTGHAVYAEGNEFETARIEKDGNTFLTITGITEAAIQDGGKVTIPDELNGEKVVALGEENVHHSIFNGNEVETLEMGKNVRTMTQYALYDTPGLTKFELPEGSAFTTDENGAALLANSEKILIKLCPEAVESYTVPDSVTSVWNMDHMNLESLDLNNTTGLNKLALAGTEIGELSIGDAKSSAGGGKDILYGASVHEFNTDESTIYETDGKALWSGNELIKVAVGADFDSDYFSRFSEVSPYAFNSIPEYLKIAASLPESATKNKVFSFYSQNDAVFVVNGEVSFCYNHDKEVPGQVGESTEYSGNIDAEKYDQIRALMYAGVPVDGTGLFKETFGVSYEDALSDPEVQEHGDAALNVVSALVYKIIDGARPSVIRGTGYGPFDEDKVDEYYDALLKAVSHYKDYNFEPDFSIEGNTISFHRSGDRYESDPFVLHTVNGSGEATDQYTYTINITTDGVTNEEGETTFHTGEEIVLVSDEKPEEISFSYNEPSLKYYKKINSNVQDVLASAVRSKAVNLQTDVNVDDLVISKQDITTNEELPGASLKLTKNGEIVDEWISSDVPHKISNPADGEYELTEVTAPDGYEVAEKITFTVVNGTVEGGEVVMYDKPVSDDIYISKKDITNSEELPGASLKLTKNGEVVDEWISEETEHKIANPEDGDYELTEVTAPDGYEVAEKISFTIKDGKLADGSDTVTMYDKPVENSVEISKVSATTGDELPGAQLILKDENGDIVDEWTSGDTPHIVKNIQDGMYTLTEVRAPEGYKIAESIEFEVKNGEAVGSPIVMEDEETVKDATPSEPEKPDTPEKPEKPETPTTPDTPSKPETPTTPSKPSRSHSSSGGGGGSHSSSRSVIVTDWYLDISKQDITTKEELPGAVLTVSKDGNVVETWTSTTEPHKMKNLADGEYTLTEVTAPDGYDVAESITFVITNKALANGESRVVMYDAPKPVDVIVPSDAPLPKTGGTTAAAVFTLASALCMMFVFKKKKSKI